MEEERKFELKIIDQFGNTYNCDFEFRGSLFRVVNLIKLAINPSNKREEQNEQRLPHKTS